MGFRGHARSSYLLLSFAAAAVELPLLVLPPVSLLMPPLSGARRHSLSMPPLAAATATATACCC